MLYIYDEKEKDFTHTRFNGLKITFTFFVK